MNLKKQQSKIFLLSVLLVLSVLIYLPGIHGPYIYDDITNILENSYIKLESLDLHSLLQASFSLSAGPLHRPIAMASFALNYYFADGFVSTAPFKLTNIAIHAINGLLVFWLVRLILARRTQLAGKQKILGDINQKTSLLLAATIALLWLVNPIQLTSVLYIVQRMTSLSALFTLLGLILYMKGRMHILAGYTPGWWLILLGIFGCGTLGILSKENAILLPVFMAVLEFLLFSTVKPWKSWKKQPPRIKYLISIGTIIIVTLFTAYAVNYALPGYAIRHFSMLERLMTEGRILFYYLSLIFVPRLDQLGIYHDDIPVSHSLVDPPTTILSLIGLVALLAVAIYYRKKYILLSLGILWFFAGHLLESTIISLEIAHEHRNYLPSLGVFFAITEVINLTSDVFKQRKWWLVLPILGIAFASITYARVIQWSGDHHNLYEARHHPDSVGTQLGFASFLINRGKYEESIQVLRHAAEIDPFEAGILINLQVAAATNGMKIDNLDHQEIIKRLVDYPTSATTVMALQNVVNCIFDKCATLQPYYEEWLRTLIEKPSIGLSEKSNYYFLLGRTLLSQGKINPAIDAYRRSYELDANFIHPLFDLANIYIQLNMPDSAQLILSEIRRANDRVTHPRPHELAAMEKKLANSNQIRKKGPPP